jgi:hypothetical protein
MSEPGRFTAANGARDTGFATFSNMDVARAPGVVRSRRRRRWIVGGALGLAITAVTVTVARLQPAVPALDRASVWVDTVRRGPAPVSIPRRSS